MRLLFLILVISFATTPGKSSHGAEPLTLTFQGRSVDSAPYYYAFPYSLEEASIEHRKIYFARKVEGEGKHLFVTSWDPTEPIVLNSESAAKVTDLDLDTINFWGRAFNSRLNGLLVQADEDKAERINLWLFADGADTAERLTDVDYVYDFVQSQDHDTIYYTARYGSSDAAKGCLEALSIDDGGKTRIRRLICDDNPSMPARINWWAGLRSDEERVIFTALLDGDRNQQELYAYDLDDGTVTKLFEGHGKSWLEAWRNWGDGTQALFSAGRDLYRYDFDTGDASLLKTFDRTISNFEVAGAGPTPPVLVTTKTPFETRLRVLAIEPSGLRILSDTSIEEDAWILDGHDGAVLLGKSSPEVYADFELLTFGEDGSFRAKDAVDGLAEVNSLLGRCDVERVRITHEDTSHATPGEVTLDAFIYRPRDPPPLREQHFVISAFYGGKNSFSSYHQVSCALGITTVSPAVRGDWRYGTEFANSNDREKADAPVRDVLAIARYLIDRFNIPRSRQIGTTGYSHGGWAAVRTLSYPGPERLDLGFAIAGGGVYDLLSIMDPGNNGETNIHGWIEKEFGRADQQELLAFLSPNLHVDRIDAPIFLFHAERDTRLSPNQTKNFAALLAREGKPHDLMIIPDQGHSIRGPEIWARIRQGALDLIAASP